MTLIFIIQNHIFLNSSQLCTAIYQPVLPAQRTHDVKIMSYFGRNDVTTSFWRNNDHIFTSSVRWVLMKSIEVRWNRHDFFILLANKKKNHEDFTALQLTSFAATSFFSHIKQQLPLNYPSN